MTERREGNLQCLEDISLIKVWTSGIKDDVLDNKETLRSQAKELTELKIQYLNNECPESSHIKEQNGIITELRLDFVSLRSAIMMTNKILIGAGIIAGIVFGALRYLG